jgi:hypothetical protein
MLAPRTISFGSWELGPRLESLYRQIIDNEPGRSTVPELLVAEA